VVKHSWGAGADRQVALLTESWWWRKRAGGGTLVMVDKVAASLTWTGADLIFPARGGFWLLYCHIGFWIQVGRLPLGWTRAAAFSVTGGDPTTRSPPTSHAHRTSIL
jgi:hypothetical protein